jgi:exosome complex component RRP46
MDQQNSSLVSNVNAGNSGVLASVYGPIQNKAWEDLLDRANVQVIFTPVSGVGSPEDRLVERHLRELANYLVITTMFPRTLIKITCQALSNDGSVLSTAVNAMVLALIDSGLPLKTSCVAITCMVHQDGRLLLDPTMLELQSAISSHCFVFDSHSAKVSNFYSTGLYTSEEV